MGRTADLSEAQTQIEAVILAQLNPRFQLQPIKPHFPRPLLGPRHHLPPQTPALQGRLDRQFAQIQGAVDRFQDHAGDGRLTQHPDLARQGQPLRGQAVQRGGRVNPTLHRREGAADQGQQGGPVIGVGREGGLHGRTLPADRKAVKAS